jgi:hypothetical protein
MGPLQVSDTTLKELLSHALKGGELAWNTPEEISSSEDRVSKLLALIAASKDYQFA